MDNTCCTGLSHAICCPLLTIFREYLGATCHDGQRIPVKIGGDVLVLEFVVTLKVFAVVPRLKYRILLHALALNPLDFVEANNRDLEDKLHELQRKLEDQEADWKLKQLQLSKDDVKYLLLETQMLSCKKKYRHTLWALSDLTRNTSGYEVESTGSVQVSRARTYVVCLSFKRPEHILRRYR